MKQKISFSSLVILIIATIDSIRNLPSSAIFGSSSIFFFFLAALLFLIPTALVSAELSASFPEKGGVYYWVRRAFGDKMGMVALWLQWTNTMVWFPSILSFIAGTLAYTINPAIASSPIYILTLVILFFWVLTFLNLRGLQLSITVNKWCGVIGTIFPLLLLPIIATIWLFTGHAAEITLTKESLLPSFGTSNTWVALISIMASFLGMELTGVHITEIDKPQKNFPKAILTASFFILISMLLGSLAIAIILPKDNINLISGVVEAFSRVFNTFNIGFLIPIITLFVATGSFGSIINWLLAPAKGFLHAAESGFLPPIFAKKNRFGAPSVILITQAILVSLFCSLLFLVPSVSAFYWCLTALSTGLYMMMYILMFGASIKLRASLPKTANLFRIPGGKIGSFFINGIGLIGAILTIIISFFPPDALLFASNLEYALIILSGNLLILLPIGALFLYQKLRVLNETYPI